MRAFNKKFKLHSRGFSLVELIVVVSIFFIITGVALFKQSRFSSDILITNTAYDVALTIREAQVFGSGSRQYGIGDVSKKSFGVTFYNDASNFKMFAESPDTNGVYESIYHEGEDELVKTISFPREQTLSDICGVEAGLNQSGEPIKKCAFSNYQGDIKSLNIAFIKPSLNAVIVVEYTDPSIDPEEFPKAEIYIRSSLGDKCRTIRVTQVGQIDVVPVEAGESGCDATEDNG